MLRWNRYMLADRSLTSALPRCRNCKYKGNESEIQCRHARQFSRVAGGDFRRNCSLIPSLGFWPAVQGFCWGLHVQHMQAQATANPAFICCPPSDAQVHGRLGAATALRKQLPQCIRLFMSSRLREDLIPHVCSASTPCTHEKLTSDLR